MNASLLPDLTGALAPVPHANSLPPTMFCDPAVFALERERIFAHQWIAVGRVDQLASRGAYITFNLAGEPLLIVRDAAGTLRAFSNVCRHKSTVIMQGAGTTRNLQCPNHHWTWSLDGNLIGAPQMQQAEGFDRAAYCLPPLRVETWHGWVLVNLDTHAPSFASLCPALTERCAPYALDTYITGPTLSYESRFNWKIQIENFSESYHHAAAHPQTLHSIFPGERSWAEDNGGQPWTWLDHVSVDTHYEPFTANVAFPFFTFSIVRPGAVTWFKMQPLDVERTLLDIVVLTHPDAPAGTAEALAKAGRAINDEDVVINERTQAGMHSRFAAPGRVSHLELACWQFRRWYVQQLAPELRAGA